MINELIILLTDKQQAELLKRSEAAGSICDLDYLQSHLNEWLQDGSKRMEHKEK